MSTHISFHVIRGDKFLTNVDYLIVRPSVVLSINNEFPNGDITIIFHDPEDWNKFLDAIKPHVVKRDNELEVVEMNKGEVTEQLSELIEAEQEESSNNSI